MIKVRVLTGMDYCVTSSAGCDVYRDDGVTKLVSMKAGQDYFTAVEGAVFVSDDTAEVTERRITKLTVVGGAGGGSGTGEKVLPLETSTLEVQHATWFVNDAQGSISVQPGVWRNEVMTCYLKTAVPVELAGVRWIYGRPTLVAGYTYVVALQQIGADVVLANLAYTIPQ